MPAKNKYNTNRKTTDRTLSLKDPELFEKMEIALTKRGIGGMSLAKQVRFILLEWLGSNEGKYEQRNEDARFEHRTRD